ncbi:MAG TPA: antibiotic biosynthesis monooxygenase [Rudaea sp.]|jgi:heme-degrading monooxygenase HmoA|uniref:antibiotic biosynthesis monooxygenase family protein n=1 Tax=Rudaea sp. TaxID=2136325 RepID=UPI002F942398
MSGLGFAKTPKPPYYAVIFSSQRNGKGEADYAAAAERMFELVVQQPGYLGVESARDTNGFGITVAYFDSEENILRWRNHAEHAATRARGKREWYEHFEVRVAKVERAYYGP